MTTAIANIKEETQTYETLNDIPEKQRIQLNRLMNQRRASAPDLQMQRMQAHWNVKGPNFIGIHELFDKVNEAVEARADRNKDRFIAMLSHELRNPLATLRNAAEILDTSDASAEDRGQAQRMLVRQIENMTRMIDDLLDVSREAGHGGAQPGVDDHSSSQAGLLECRRHPA